MDIKRPNPRSADILNDKAKALLFTSVPKPHNIITLQITGLGRNRKGMGTSYQPISHLSPRGKQ